MRKDISSLAELEIEQKKLNMTMEFTRHEFARSLGSSRDELKGFLLKKVALPMGAVGLGMVAAKQAFGSDSKKVKHAVAPNLFRQLLPMAINLIQAYLLKDKEKEIKKFKK